MFDSFINDLRRRLQGDLPGLEAQVGMAPAFRPRELPDAATLEQARKSSVLVLFYPLQETPHLVLMKRNEYPGVHSGQISFPGGRVEESDLDYHDTALREAQEEVGVNRHEVEILGELSKLYIPPSGFLVQPVVGFSRQRPDFVPDPSEVKEILEVPVSHLQDAANRKQMDMPIQGGIRKNIPYFDVFGHTVWGATAMMLSELLHLLKE
ncbi:MAG: CoA pyrophosphatase [Bacteroidia bacterium]|nr:CoA pyrophosphatase [Bacteroidia bacterium]